MTKKNTIKKEDIAEDYCFFCKDGGSLRICDYKNCLKSFHPQCVGKDDSLLESDDRWHCCWHFCILCGKPAKFRCFCCPSAVCGRCLCDTEFAVIKGTKGLCSMCLELALLIEDRKDVNSNGVKVDFNDTATYEYLYKCYWEVLKEKEGLTSQQLHSSDRMLKNGKNYDAQANYKYREECARDFDDDSISEGDDWIENQLRCRKKKRGKPSPTKRKGKPKTREYLGWASKQLVEFLKSIGKDATQELSQLQSLLGRKSVHKNGIHKLLTVHFSENLEKSEDSVGFSSEEDDNVFVPCKKQRKSSPDRKFEEKEIATIPRQGYLAAIVSGNIKLVYLKRSLVLELAKQLDKFNDKIVGSFVRVKSDPNDYFQKNSHMLVQVKGIKETSMKEETASMILLQVSNRLKEIRVCELSDDDFTREEIEDLNRRMGTRMFERPTVTPSEKSRLLHEVPEVVAEAAVPEPALKDSWKEHREDHKASLALALGSISRIQNCILEHNVVSSCLNDGMDAAGMMGLQFAVAYGTSKVIPERKQQDLKKVSISTGVEGNETSRNQNPQEVTRHCNETPVPQLQAPKEESADSKTGSVCPGKQHKHGDAAGVGVGEKLPWLVDIREHLKSENHRSEVVKLSIDEIQVARTPVLPLLPREESADRQTKTSHQMKQSKHGDATSGGEKLTRPIDPGVHVKVENHQVEVIDLSDDEIDDAAIATSNQTSADHDSSIWYCISPQGNTKGPYSMKLLKQWSASSSSHCELHFKVYKSGQRPEDALLLVDAFRQNFNRK
ncbi:Exostosin family protein [Hibiscus syriacus]|uniref:Exostosin family protein n=1 Tax=Hibiscus syriacus TaxID=106335 RepID=A0A6A2XRQ1_HIBSY|nr:Exostosin family protein [Hibiscus syriacus]